MPDLSILSDGLPQGHGPLGLLSGDEFTPPARAFDTALFDGLSEPRIGIILCADHRAGPNSLRVARAHFEAWNADVFELDIHADELEPFDVAYIAGGSPKELIEHLKGNARWRAIEARWKEGAALAGASAGAMVLCARMLVPEDGADVPTRWTEGVGLVRTAALAVHASSRPRAWLETIARDAPLPLLALDDATGVIVRDGAQPTVVGPGEVTFVSQF